MRTPENIRSCDFAPWIFGLLAQLLVDFSQDCADISPPQEPGVVQQLIWYTRAQFLWFCERLNRDQEHFHTHSFSSLLTAHWFNPPFCASYGKVCILSCLSSCWFNNAGKSEVSTAEKRCWTFWIKPVTNTQRPSGEMFHHSTVRYLAWCLSQVPQLGGKVELSPVFLRTAEVAARSSGWNDSTASLPSINLLHFFSGVQYLGLFQSCCVCVFFIKRVVSSLATRPSRVVLGKGTVGNLSGERLNPTSADHVGLGLAADFKCSCESGLIAQGWAVLQVADRWPEAITSGSSSLSPSSQSLISVRIFHTRLLSKLSRSFRDVSWRGRAPRRAELITAPSNWQKFYFLYMLYDGLMMFS